MITKTITIIFLILSIGSLSYFILNPPIGDIEIETEKIDDLSSTSSQPQPITEPEEDILVRQPQTYEQAQMFIRPEEARPYLKNFNLNEDNIHDNIEKIMTSMKISYFHDGFNYWQTPEETLSTRRGDCEDWAIAKVSLLKSYDPSIESYVIMWNTHASVLYHIPGTNVFSIWDQGNVYKNIALDDNPENDYSITQENKINFRRNLNNYFKEYGLDSYDGQINTLFNDKDVIYFENGNEDLIDWAIEKIKD